MRRMILGTVCAVTGCVLLVVFGIALLRQTVWATVQPQEKRVQLPGEVDGTNLKAYFLSQYRGPSLEDRSSDVTVEAAVLMVENTGCFLATGAVVLETADTQLVFEIHDLPPGGRAMVLEKDGQSYVSGILTGCYGWEREERPESTGRVVARSSGGNVMEVCNLTQGVVPVVKVCYRSQDPDSGVFLGGVSYSVEVRDLQPGEKRRITPPHYGKNSVILYVITWTED